MTHDRSLSWRVHLFIARILCVEGFCHPNRALALKLNIMDYVGTDFAPKLSQTFERSNRSRLSIRRKLGLRRGTEQSHVQQEETPSEPQFKCLVIKSSSLLSRHDKIGTYGKKSNVDKTRNERVPTAGWKLLTDENGISSSSSKRPKFAAKVSTESETGGRKDESSEEFNTPTTRRKKTIRNEKKSYLPKSSELEAKGFCRVCQLPFICIKDSEVSEHVRTCEVSEDSFETECYDGLNCKCRVRAHYSEFKHTWLAKFRNNCEQSTSSSSKRRKPVQIEIDGSLETPACAPQGMPFELAAVSTYSTKVSENPFLDSDFEHSPYLPPDFGAINKDDFVETAAELLEEGQPSSGSSCASDKDKLSVKIKWKGQCFDFSLEDCDNFPAGLALKVCGGCKSMALEIRCKEVVGQYYRDKQGEAAEKDEKPASFPIKSSNTSSAPDCSSYFSASSSIGSDSRWSLWKPINAFRQAFSSLWVKRDKFLSGPNNAFILFCESQ
ncbi:uncharacterized protein LOC132194575 isoform X2 [Neocloeon triangulifer]|uniref:uncharacterized protein LOC132194575 isoform X2 n=1 Tax=Neocloeon triangulifer TaxID=2078957 RepID=UPI00286FA08C|nr:uncharacterized protein LOC132194575 isoform X2 [Neocloeon triangulifer]